MGRSHGNVIEVATLSVANAESVKIKELKSATSTREIQETLEDLPVGLEAAYSRIFRRLADNLLPSPR